MESDFFGGAIQDRKPYLGGPVTQIVGFAGSSSTLNNTTGYRPIITAEFTDAYNISDNGWATWPNLVNFGDLSQCTLIIFDQSNDGADDTPEVEALIRLASARGQRVIGIVNPSWNATTDDQVNVPNNKTAMEQHVALLDAYSVPYVDGWQLCKDHVTGGGHLSDYFADTAHWTGAGYSVVAAAVILVLDSGTIPTPLSTRVYAASADYEQTPVIKLGTGYDSRTGAWSDTGSSVASSSAGATITYSGTFRKFGIYRASGAYPTVTVTIDGSAPITDFALYVNGYDIGTRGAHTVVITVTSTVQIDEFWAI